jgi:prophage maintenance system killer protein
MAVTYLSMSRYLAIAEANAGVNGDELLDDVNFTRRVLAALQEPMARAVGGSDRYPSIPNKAAALEFALIREDPLDKSNVLVAHESALEFVYLNGFEFDPRRSAWNQDELWDAAARGMTESHPRLSEWFDQCCTRAN